MVRLRLAILLLISCLITQHACFQIHYRACNIEDFSRHMKAACMRWHRDSKSLLLGPHGALLPYDDSMDEIQLSDAALTAILQASKPQARRRKQISGISKRDTGMAELSDRKCCDQTCSIDASDVAPHCAKWDMAKLSILAPLDVEEFWRRKSLKDV